MLGIEYGKPLPFLPPSLPHPPSLFPFFLVLTALGVLCMLPVLQRLGDAYGFYLFNFLAEGCESRGRTVVVVLLCR